MRGVASLGTTKASSAAAASAPPDPPHRPTVSTPSVPCRLDRPQHVGRIAAGADGDQKIAAPRQRLDLPRENPIESRIVADTRQHRRIRGQSEGSQGASIPLEPIDELRRQMLSIRGAPAVSTEQDFSPSSEHVCHASSHCRDACCIFPAERQRERGALLEHRPDTLFHSFLRIAAGRFTGHRHEFRASPGPSSPTTSRPNSDCSIAQL